MAWHVLKMRCHSGTGVVHNVSAPACFNLPRQIALPSHGFCGPALQVGDFESAAERAYNRSFGAKAERQEGDRTGEGLGNGWSGVRSAGMLLLGRHSTHPCPSKVTSVAATTNHRIQSRALLLVFQAYPLLLPPLLLPPAPFHGRAGKMKALAREVRGFSGRTSLPVYAASAICLRYDPGARPAQVHVGVVIFGSIVVLL